MIRHSYPQILGLICAGAMLASCAQQAEPVRIPTSASARLDHSVSGQVFQAVNSYRHSQGKRDLQRHAGLDRLALNHSEYLRQHRGSFSLHGSNVSHMGFDGRATVVRERYGMDNVSENVASENYPGSAPAPILVQLWKNSKDHHKNMLDQWTHTGLGVVVDSDGTVFATQLFATKSYSQLTTRNRFNSF